MARWMETVAVVALAFLSVAPALHSQDVVWSNSYGGPYNEKGYACQPTDDGGSAILGSTYSFGHGDHDIYLIRLDSLGDTLWTRTFGGDSTDYGYDIHKTYDGGFVIVGSSKSFGSSKKDVYLIRVNAYGDTQWTRTIGGGGDDEGRSVRQTVDSGFVICGTTNSWGAGYTDVYLVKTDSAGNTLWSKTYGGPGGEAGSAVRQTVDSGFVLIGSTGSFGEGYSSIYAVRTDRNGDSLWATTYGGNKADFGSSVEATQDGGYVFVGSTASYGLGCSDAYLIKTDPYGNVDWQQTYGGTREDRAYSVYESAAGGFALAGTTESFSSGIDIYLVRTNPLGDVMWSNHYGGSKSDYCYTVQQDRHLDFLLIGCSYSYSSGGSDMYVMRVKGDQGTSVEEPLSGQIPVGFELAQNYPNPFNLSTTIEYSIPARSSVTLTIYNLLGQVANVWRTPSAPAGTYRLHWDGRTSSGNTAASGVYFYHLRAGPFSQSKKMVLLK